MPAEVGGPGPASSHPSHGIASDRIAPPETETTDPHQWKFILSMGLAVGFTAASCVFPPAAGAAAVCYAEAIRQARRVPELNTPTEPIPPTAGSI